MQIVSNGENLHEISNPVFWEKDEKYHQCVVCWIRPDSGEGLTANTQISLHIHGLLRAW